MSGPMQSQILCIKTRNKQRTAKSAAMCGLDARIRDTGQNTAKVTGAPQARSLTFSAVRLYREQVQSYRCGTHRGHAFLRRSAVRHLDVFDMGKVLYSWANTCTLFWKLARSLEKKAYSMLSLTGEDSMEDFRVLVGVASTTCTWSAKRSHHQILGSCEVYGSVYFMRDPMLLTSDLDIMKEVFLKDFTNFTNRYSFPRRIVVYPMNLCVAFTGGDTWRRQRHTMTPTFSTSKLKLMSPHINRCCNNLCRALQRYTEKRELADVKRIFGAFTMDAIAGTAFGLQTNSLVDENNPILVAIANMVKMLAHFGWRSALETLFPFLERVFVSLNNVDAPSKEFATVCQIIDQLIDERKQNGKSHMTSDGRVDFLQLLLEAEATQAEIVAKPEDRQLTRDEIIAQCLIIFGAGFETTATTLQYMTYLLALNPDKQETLYNEIVTNIGDAPPTYETVMGIKYLDNAIRETLRLFPPVPLVGRRAAEARTIKGVSIAAGTSVGVPIYALMHDEEIFSEPEKFIPERFDDENIPAVIRELAFGMGPRQCIGMRLALYEAKMAAVTILRRFKFVQVPETPQVVNVSKSTLSAPDKPILLGVELRQ